MNRETGHGQDQTFSRYADTLAGLVKRTVQPHKHGSKQAEGVMPELELSEEEGGENYKLWPAIAGGRASASLPSVIQSCQTKCKLPPDRRAPSAP